MLKLNLLNAEFIFYPVIFLFYLGFQLIPGSLYLFSLFKKILFYSDINQLFPSTIFSSLLITYCFVLSKTALDPTVFIDSSKFESESFTTNYISDLFK